MLRWVAREKSPIENVAGIGPSMRPPPRGDTTRRWGLVLPPWRAEAVGAGSGRRRTGPVGLEVRLHLVCGHLSSLPYAALAMQIEAPSSSPVVRRRRLLL